MSPRRAYAAGNWKMHGLSGDLAQIDEIASAANAASGIQAVLCLPATLIDRTRERGVAIGGQDCHPEPSGAHTGDVSATMLRDAGAACVIVGHSERRSDHDENDDTIAAKARAAWSAGLIAIICIGETQAEYQAGRTLEVLRRQLAGSVPTGATPDNTVIAYEPVWAIGTGLTPSVDEIGQTHAAIRSTLAERHGGGGDISILYGGSVKPSNAAEIFALADVDGGLVGGASLTAADFVPIIHALDQAKRGA
ncbi:MAG: triose-phosphate isomerase [Ruegeria sp.]